MQWSDIIQTNYCQTVWHILIDNDEKPMSFEEKSKWLRQAKWLFAWTQAETGEVWPNLPCWESDNQLVVRGTKSIIARTDSRVKQVLDPLCGPECYSQHSYRIKQVFKSHFQHKPCSLHGQYIRLNGASLSQSSMHSTNDHCSQHNSANAHSQTWQSPYLTHPHLTYHLSCLYISLQFPC